MHRFLALVRMRLLPAALTAAGVALVVGGLLTYADPATAGLPEPSRTPVAALPTPRSTPGSSPSASGAPTLPSARPSTSTAPGGSPTFPPGRVATRIAIPALRIDLPVIRPPNDDYPLCDVALFIEELAQPGQGGAVYIYAHARAGMFLPLLDGSEVRNGADMKGMLVQVWTSDEQLFIYEITEVRRHQTNLDDAIGADHDQLWLQTSEGPRGTIPKLQVVAEPVSNGPAPNPADAHPTPKPRDCS